MAALKEDALQMDAQSADEIAIDEELSADGHAAGVEREELALEENIKEPFDPALIDVVTRTMTVDLLLARLRRGVLDLAPDFQRQAGVWGDEAQSKLVESLLLRIPVPNLYAAESGDEGWSIVDGIQRLTTIARFVDPALVPNMAPLRLRGLEYLKSYEGNLYGDLPPSLRTRIDETELLVHLIRSGTPEPVKFNIFARINTGGLPLTSQELRHALIPGDARTYLTKLAHSQTFRKATNYSIKPDRMADREMVLRFVAFLRTDPQQYARGDLDGFLRDAMVQLNHADEAVKGGIEQDFYRALTLARDIFGDQAFRKRSASNADRRLPINKAIFESLAVNLARVDAPQSNTLKTRRRTVDERFAALTRNDRFFDSVSGGTGDVRKVKTRFSMVRDLLEEVLA
ncbi:DUF262 domain-containing protein [Microbacterium aurum]|uniref:GmrSD restriction endonuclease domain-containing protein n=1 Tax=Microbacterium aurum TaxID=36805 RepID=UPI001EF53A98|nr:DUF262 domain-containing protein [Microbacterium aurum]